MRLRRRPHIINIVSISSAVLLHAILSSVRAKCFCPPSISTRHSHLLSFHSVTIVTFILAKTPLTSSTTYPKNPDNPSRLFIGSKGVAKNIVTLKRYLKSSLPPLSSSSLPPHPITTKHDNDLNDDHYLSPKINPTTSSTENNTKTPTTIKRRGLLHHILSRCLEIIVPLVMPFVAYNSHETCVAMVNRFVDGVGAAQTIKDDSGPSLNIQPLEDAYRTQFIIPAASGIVLPAVSLLFATLIASAIEGLLQRQLEVRLCVTTEAGLINHLTYMINSFPKKNKMKIILRNIIKSYTTRIIDESQPGINYHSDAFISSMDSEINRFVSHLNMLSTTHSSSQDPLLLSEMYEVAMGLIVERSNRVAALQNNFPPLHYASLAVLAVSICLLFLIGTLTHNDVVVLRDRVQLKILWMMLLGTFTALAFVCVDLADPFTKSYSITRDTKHLVSIRDNLV